MRPFRSITHNLLNDYVSLELGPNTATDAYCQAHLVLDDPSFGVFVCGSLCKCNQPYPVMENV